MFVCNYIRENLVLSDRGIWFSFVKKYKFLSYANWRLLKTVKKMLFFRHFPWRSRAFNLLYPNISMHVLHTVLYTFPEVLTRRIRLKIKSFISW